MYLLNKIIHLFVFIETFLFFSPSSGNLLEPPTIGQKSGSKFTKVEKKTIRGKGYDSDSDSD